jgi:hypothetical protein
MQRELAGAQPWILFMAVLMWIGFSLVCLVSLFVVVALVLSLPGFGPGGLELIGFAFYPITAIVYAVFAWRLQQYAGNLRAFGRSNHGEDLLAALRAQKSFWRLAGIIVIAYLFVIAVTFFGAMLWAMMSM